MVNCDCNCDNCDRYTTYHSVYDDKERCFKIEYDCLVANKFVTKRKYDDGTEKITSW